MHKFYRPMRMAVLFICMAVLLTVYISALYKMQIYDTAAVDERFAEKTYQSYETLVARRGEIYDRNGILLVSSRPSFNLTLSRSLLLAAENTNEIIQTLIQSCIENGVKYNDTLPITSGAPFIYHSETDSTQRTRLKNYIEHFDDLNEDISASELITWLKNRYKIDYTMSISEARLIIGVRYEMETRVIMSASPYIFAEDVSVDFIAAVKGYNYAGVNVETGTVREYKTDLAAHLLGFIGLMDAAETEKYKELGYPMDAYVGKDGVEQAFEAYLHGINGQRRVLYAADGSVIDTTLTKVPVPGSNVYLALDIKLQEVVENAMASHIEQINLERDDESKVTGGAVVVESVKTGELLASASYPTFDITTFRQNWNTLRVDPTKPILNRAVSEHYNPGSTFKMVTALAALQSGTIGRWTQIEDRGRFDKYETPQPTCWIFSSGTTHGRLDVVGAIEHSCNYFFYQLGDWMNRYAIPEAAALFGLGSKTGLEISEVPGTLATPEYKREKLNEGWWSADQLYSAIGQSHNMFTPVQITNYISTIANDGTRYRMTILNKVKSADYSELLYSHEPEIVNIIDDPINIGYLQEGMRAVSRTGTASSVFRNYPVSVASKTGTVQSDLSSINNGVFVCYAPVNDPEIAITVVIEKGASGSAVMEIAKTILDYYFSGEQGISASGDLILNP